MKKKTKILFSHPNIAKLYKWFHDDNNICLALEIVVGGDLYVALQQTTNGFGESRSAKYTFQIADALNYCHQQGIVHRDVKLENILLTANDDIQLSDFGWAANVQQDILNMYCGTLEYMSPEM